MYLLVLFILINAGVSVSLTRSKLTEPIRKKITAKSKWFGDLVNCPMCLGYWTSIPCYLFVYHTYSLDLLAFMFIGSFSSYFLYKLSNLG